MKGIILRMNKRKITLKISLGKYGFFLITSILVLAGCNGGPPSEKVQHYAENFEIIGDEKEEMLNNTSETIFNKSDRTNEGAEEVQIPYVPDDGIEIKVPEGRYQIVGGITGNVHIYDDKGDILYYNILGWAYGVSSITVDLDESHTIHADSGLDQVSVIPVETVMANELSAGIWEVGLDIEAGSYMVTGMFGGYGYLQIFDPNGDTWVYEVIGGEFSSTESVVELIEGQKLRIVGISALYFEPIG